METKPTTFSELVLISGLSHGENVWIGNASDLIRDKKATLSDVISVRDDIMVYLMLKGLEPKEAFDIMEGVRKGKGLKPEQEKLMRERGVPAWYVDSCKKIKYMFPQAHAAAYVTMAFRIAYFKVYHPIEFYISYFTIRADVFDAALMIHGPDKVKKSAAEIENKATAQTARDRDTLTILEVCLEMYARGYKFLPIDLYKSHAFNFIKADETSILPPLNALAGLGDVAAENIMKTRENGPFLSQDDFKRRAKVPKNVMELFEQNGCFKSLPASSQIGFFDDLFG
jgi:DNA polymerase-3 subunit alpha (Gram-positive type)